MLGAVHVFAEEVAEEGGGGLELVLPHTYELIAGLIAFGFVFLAIRLWAWPAISRMLENRQQAIAAQLQEAEQSKTEAQGLLDDYRKQLDEAKSEAGRIIEEARQTAEQLRGETVDRANAEAEQILTRARQEAETEKERALADARNEVANITIDLTERLVGENLDQDRQRRLVEQYLTELENR
jgi:F-type H+-transporting ATPase subunit b